jgi:hypothetical protein
MPMTPSGKIAKAELAKIADDTRQGGSPQHAVYNGTSISASPIPPAK